MAKALERPFLLLKDMDALKRMRQPDLFLSLKRDLALVSSSACFNKSVFLCFLPFFFLGAAKQENQEFATKLIAKERAQKSIKADLKNTQNQAEYQCKRFYHTEIKLATEKYRVLKLKTEFQKAKEAAEALEQASYNRGVQETEFWLAEELVEVCRDYCKEVWAEAFNRAGVPAAFEWRNAKNIFSLEDIREVPTVLPLPLAFALPSSKQPSTSQASLPPLEVFKGPNKAGDQGQEAEVAKGEMAKGKWASQDGPQLEDMGKGKEVKPLPEAKGTEVALMIKDVISKAKDVEPKSKATDPKDDPPRAKAQFQDLFPLFFSSSLYFLSFFLFWLWQFATVYNVPLFFCLMKRYQFLLREFLFSLQYLSMVGVVIILPSDET